MALPTLFALQISKHFCNIIKWAHILSVYELNLDDPQLKVESREYMPDIIVWNQNALYASNTFLDIAAKAFDLSK